MRRERRSGAQGVRDPLLTGRNWCSGRINVRGRATNSVEVGKRTNSQKESRTCIVRKAKPQRGDNGNDHSFTRLPLHKGLTCPEGECAWAVPPPWLTKEVTTMQKQVLIKVLRADLLPLEIQWSSICAEKEMCRTQHECHAPGCCFSNECARSGCIGVVELQLSIN